MIMEKFRLRTTIDGDVYEICGICKGTGIQRNVHYMSWDRECPFCKNGFVKLLKHTWNNQQEQTDENN